jgi:uncharacterized membrane protein YccC
MITLKLKKWCQDWLPSISDLPDAFRISTPMIVVLLVFGSQGHLAAGVSGLITAWLVGVQGRSLCYVKRAWFLGISTILCLLANLLAVILFFSPLLAAINLCLFALLYGLTSNQRSHIRMFTYNFGFSLIIAMHFLNVGQPLHLILLSTVIGGGAAWFSSLAFWPFSEGRIGLQLLRQTRTIMALWLSQLSQGQYLSSDPSVNLGRNQFDDVVSRLVYWLRSTSAKKRASLLRPELIRFLRLAEDLARLERQLQGEKKLLPSVETWLSGVAHAVENQTLLPVYQSQNHEDLLPSEILNTIKQLHFRYHQDEVISTSTWSMADISRIWPKDTVAFGRDLKAAFSWHSREWQHGFRIAVTLGMTQFIAFYYQIPQGYWITLTAFIVLLTSPIGVTTSRIRYRFYGTVLGAPIAFLLIFTVPKDFLLILTCVFTFIAFATCYKPRYEVHVLWITVMIVFAIAILTPNDIYIAVYRLVDTLIGVGIAYLANYLIFPAWTRRWLDQHTLSVLLAQRALLEAVCVSPESFHLRHWQSVQAFRVLNQELHYFALEPNTSVRDLKDWQTLSILCRRIHDDLLILMVSDEQAILREHKTDFLENMRVWVRFFPVRYNTLEPLELLSTVALSEHSVILRLADDLNHLTLWLMRQKPYEL